MGFRARHEITGQMARSVIDYNPETGEMVWRNTSGTVGVHWHKAARKWKAEICHEGASIHLGVFTEIDDAVAARKAAEARFGYSARHGERRHGL